MSDAQTKTTENEPKTVGKLKLIENGIRLSVCLILAWIGWTLHNDAVALGELRTEISRLQMMEKAAAEANSQVVLQMDSQTALLGRVLGDAIQIKLPADIEAAFTFLESRLVATAKWPDSATSAQDYRDNLASLMRRIPAWAESERLGRINTLRWSAAAFEYLNQPEEPQWEALDRQAKSGGDLLAAAPAGIPEDLKKSVLDRSSTLATKVRESILARAKTVAAADAKDETEISSLLLALDTLEPDPATRDATAALQRADERVQLFKEAKSLSGRFDSIASLKQSQPSLYEHALVTLQNEALNARVAVALAGQGAPELEAVTKKIEMTLSQLRQDRLKREQENQERASRAYQRWAIQQIRAFNAEMNRARELADKRGMLGEEWTAEEYKIVGNAVAQRLLPIGPLWLDLVLQDHLQTTLRSALRKLDDSPAHRDYVLTKSVEIAKESPDTLQ